MRIFKYLVIFIVAFLTAAVVIFTFQQQAFKVSAPIRLGSFYGPVLPVYVYVGVAFCVGLAIGVILAVYNFISANMRTRHMRHQIKNNEETIHQLQQNLEECREALQQDAMHRNDARGEASGEDEKSISSYDSANAAADDTASEEDTQEQGADAYGNKSDTPDVSPEEDHTRHAPDSGSETSGSGKNEKE
jgi:uncharacterized membrane protein YciS (DUF1049 family)